MLDKEKGCVRGEAMVKETPSEEEEVKTATPDFCFHAKMEVKAAEGDASAEVRAIEGFVSTNDMDRVEDVVEPSAFRDSLANYMKNPILFYNHESRSDPIGQITMAEIREMGDTQGLYVRAELATSETNFKAQKVWDMINEGLLRAFSFGFRIQKRELDEENDIRRILKLDLLEVSVVGIPANPHATFSVAKGLVLGNDMATADLDLTDEQEEELFTNKLLCKFHGHDELDDDYGDDKSDDEKGATKYLGLPLADRKAAWRFSAADGNSLLGPNGNNWKRYRSAHFWFDPQNQNFKKGYKLPFAKLVGNRLVAFPRGVFAAAAVIQGSRGGVNLPQGDVAAVKRHIAKYYKKMGEKPPWNKELNLGGLVFATTHTNSDVPSVVVDITGNSKQEQTQKLFDFIVQRDDELAERILLQSSKSFESLCKEMKALQNQIAEIHKATVKQAEESVDDTGGDVSIGSVCTGIKKIRQSLEDMRSDSGNGQEQMQQEDS